MYYHPLLVLLSPSYLFLPSILPVVGGVTYCEMELTCAGLLMRYTLHSSTLLLVSSLVVCFCRWFGIQYTYTRTRDLQFVQA